MVLAPEEMFIEARTLYRHQGQMIQQRPTRMAQSSLVRKTSGRSDLPPIHHYVSPHKDEDDEEEEASDYEKGCEIDSEKVRPAIVQPSFVRKTGGRSDLPPRHPHYVSPTGTKRLQEGQKIAKGFKNTSPDDEDEKQACIRELFDATIMYTMDVVGMPAHDGRKAQAARRIVTGYYTKRSVASASETTRLKSRKSSQR